MANSRKSSKKSTPVTEFPQPATSTTVADIPQEFQETPEPAPQAATPPPKNPFKKKNPILPQNGHFFARVAAVSPEDWDSQRIYLYLYILEPLCNLKQSGGKAYLNRYSQPVKDEHQIAVEYGSGKYRLMLTYNRVGGDADKSEIAQYDFEIYNPQYPPKVPKAAWINDSRNQKWEALLPKEAAATPITAASTIVDAMKMVSDIRRDVREEMEPEPADSQSPSEMVQTFKAMKEILQPAGVSAAPAPDPFDTAAKIMQMRANDPMMAVMMELLKNANTANEAARQREYELLQKQASAPPKGLMDQILEIAALGEKLDPLKKLFGFANGNGTAEGVRTGRTTALDVARDLGSKFFESDLASGVGQYLASLATRNVSGNGAPAQMSANPATAVQPRPADDFQAFIQNVLNPALLRHYIQGFTGGEFAGWLYDGYPDRVQQLQNFTHPMMPGLRGATAIIQAYKHTDAMWPTLSSARPAGEAAFTEFVNEFCAWKPDVEGVIDTEVVEGGEHEEGPERI